MSKTHSHGPSCSCTQGFKAEEIGSQRLLNRDNIQSTWKLIGSLIDRTNNNFQILIKKLVCDNRIYSYEVIYEMLHILNCDDHGLLENLFLQTKYLQ